MIIIEGNDYLENGTILAQGRIKPHTNLFHLNIEKTQHSILENPWIENVSIKKVFPNQLKIELIERKPNVLIFYDNHFYLVNEEGIILSALDQFDEDYQLYILTGLSIGSKKPGEFIENPEFHVVQRVIYALENIFPDQFDKLQVISADEYLLFHKRKDIKVRIRDGEQLINEWYLLERALQKIFEEEIQLEEINMLYEERLSIILQHRN